MGIYNLWLSTVKLPNQIKRSLVECFGSAEQLWNYSRDGGTFNSNSIKKAMSKLPDLEYFKNMNDVIEKNNIKAVTFKEPDFPTKLKEIEDCPFLLFYYGNIKKVSELRSVSIVGSRQSTNYGKDVANEISSGLAKCSINIVSGMARGIDSSAHWACLQNAGFTTGVAGCGLDRIYPPENKRLFEAIKENGCIISEFPPTTPPLAYNFPIRNRIISGLSDLIIVVEASEKSGSLITASRALEQNKNVMAVPGSVFSSKSKGANELIKDGAYIFIDMEYLFNFLNIKETINSPKTGKRSFSKYELTKIYDTLTDIPMHIDDLLRITNIDISTLYELLLEMQLTNSIRCISGSYYVKVNEFL